MSSDLIFNDKSFGFVIASAGTWSIVGDEQKISITYPHGRAGNGFQLTSIDIPFSTFLKYKKHCDKTSVDVDLTERNISYVKENYGPKDSSAKQTYNSLNKN